MFKVENINGVLSVADKENVYPLAGNIEGLKENSYVEADFFLKRVVEKDETGKNRSVIKVFIYSWRLIKEG